MEVEAEALKPTELEERLDRFFRAYYSREILRVVRGYPEEKSLVVNFEDLDRYDISLADEMLNNPDVAISAAQRALAKIELPVDYPSIRLNLRFANLPPTSRLMIRDIRSADVGKLISVEGIVRKATDVRPKLVVGAFECQRCGSIMHITQSDDSLKEPYLCESCEKRGPFKLDVDSSVFVDSQKVLIQENLEDLRGGEHPKQIAVLLEDDLTGKITPGDSIEVIGILRAAKRKMGNMKSRVFDIFIEANNFNSVQIEFEEVRISKEDEREIVELSRDTEIYERIRRSIAPHIFGYDEIKEAIMYQLFSAPPVELTDGGRIRGDSHIIIMGEPATGKSEILQYVAKELAPRGVYASGKGTSGAGLCVSPSSFLCLSNGKLSPIAETVEERMKRGRKKYTEGVWVAREPDGIGIFSLNGASEAEVKKATQYWKLVAPPKMAKITTRTGREIEVTPGTPLLWADGEEVGWKKAGEIRVGEFIACAREIKVDETKVPLSIDLIDGNPIIYGCEDIVKEALSKIKEMHNLTIRETAKKIKVDENKLYHSWVNESARGKPRLRELLRLVDFAGIPRERVVESIKFYSEYHGHRITLPARITGDLLYMAGLVAGDGDIRKTPKGGVSIRFSNSNEYLLESFKNIVKKLFNVDIRIAPASKSRPASARFHSKLVGEILQRLGIPQSPKSHRVDLSPELLNLPDELLSHYISGLFDCDACVVHRKKKGSSYIEFVTTSEALARKLHLALLRFGIISKLRKSHATGKKSHFFVDGKRKVIISRHDKYCLYIRGKEHLTNFRNKIGFRNKDKRKLLDEIIAGCKKGNTNMDVVPFAGRMFREIREAFGVSSKQIFGYKNYDCEHGRFRPSRRLVERFIERIEELKGNYKERIYFDVPVRREMYKKAREYMPPEELSRLLGIKRSTLRHYFTGSRRTRIPYSTLEKMCRLLEERGVKEFSLGKIEKYVAPGISDVLDRISEAESRLAELKKYCGVFWDEVVEVEYRKPDYDYVYDLTVEDSHNFLVNGIITHNTAAAVKDEFGDGGWSLEAGALVLGDRGVACIDEFDKMEPSDRSAMHEAMEQQSVSIAKAGILATFRSRCAILAAANPKYGRFDEYRPISEQVNLPPTILSRFDLIFFVKDDLSKTREIARHILDTASSPESIKPPLAPEFLKKYIAYARQHVFPELSDEARKVIEDFYVEMREVAQRSEDVPIPLTARQLWAIVRLAKASARVRLSSVVEAEDAHRAIALVKTSLAQAGLDLETGKVDIDKIYVGVTKSQRDKIKEILSIIRELEDEYGTARRSEILSLAEERGISKGTTQELIERLRQQGDIFEPKYDHFKTT